MMEKKLLGVVLLLVFLCHPAICMRKRPQGIHPLRDIIWRYGGWRPILPGSPFYFGPPLKYQPTVSRPSHRPLESYKEPDYIQGQAGSSVQYDSVKPPPPYRPETSHSYKQPVKHRPRGPPPPPPPPPPRGKPSSGPHVNVAPPLFIELDHKALQGQDPHIHFHLENVKGPIQLEGLELPYESSGPSPNYNLRPPKIRLYPPPPNQRHQQGYKREPQKVSPHPPPEPNLPGKNIFRYYPPPIEKSPTLKPHPKPLYKEKPKRPLEVNLDAILPPQHFPQKDSLYPASAQDYQISDDKGYDLSAIHIPQSQDGQNIDYFVAVDGGNEHHKGSVGGELDNTPVSIEVVNAEGLKGDVLEAITGSKDSAQSSQNDLSGNTNYGPPQSHSLHHEQHSNVDYGPTSSQQHGHNSIISPQPALENVKKLKGIPLANHPIEVYEGLAPSDTSSQSAASHQPSEDHHQSQTSSQASEQQVQHETPHGAEQILELLNLKGNAKIVHFPTDLIDQSQFQAHGILESINQANYQSDSHSQEETQINNAQQSGVKYEGQQSHPHDSQQTAPRYPNQYDSQRQKDQHYQNQQQQYNPPRQEQYKPPPQQEQQYQPSQQGHYESPPKQEQHFQPPRQENYESPPKQEQHYQPPRQENYESPPKQEQHYQPPRQEHYESPPKQEQHYQPPHQEQHELAPQEQQYQPPPQEEKHSSVYNQPPALNYEYEFSQHHHSQSRPIDVEILKYQHPSPNQEQQSTSNHGGGSSHADGQGSYNSEEPNQEIKVIDRPPPADAVHYEHQNVQDNNEHYNGQGISVQTIPVDAIQNIPGIDVNAIPGLSNENIQASQPQEKDGDSYSEEPRPVYDGQKHYEPLSGDSSNTGNKQSDENQEEPQLYHAYYAPADHKPPEGYVRLSLEEFNNLFKGADIQYIGDESQENPTYTPNVLNDENKKADTDEEERRRDSKVYFRQAPTERQDKWDKNDQVPENAQDVAEKYDEEEKEKTIPVLAIDLQTNDKAHDRNDQDEKNKEERQEDERRGFAPEEIEYEYEDDDEHYDDDQEEEERREHDTKNYEKEHDEKQNSKTSEQNSKDQDQEQKETSKYKEEGDTKQENQQQEAKEEPKEEEKEKSDTDNGKDQSSVTPKRDHATNEQDDEDYKVKPTPEVSLRYGLRLKPPTHTG